MEGDSILSLHQKSSGGPNCKLQKRTRRWWYTASFCLLSLVLGFPPAAHSQQADALAELRLELKRLREEVASLREELCRNQAGSVQVSKICSNSVAGQEGSVRSESAALSTAPQEPQKPSTEARLEVLEAQVAEQAQTKVESGSRFPVKISGTVHFGTFWNSGEANWLDLPNVVNPPPTPPLSQGSFNASLRQSRLGVSVTGPTLGPFQSSGFVEIDFFGGIPNFQTGPVIALPRLLYAFMRLEGDRTAFEFGHDEMILAPRNPTSLAAMAFPSFFRSGNLYLRAPQARVERILARGDRSELELTGGFLAPAAGDYQGPYAFVPPNLSGERSRQPAVQTRLAWRSWPQDAEGDRGMELGVSAHTGSQHLSTGNQRSWAVAVDFDADFKAFGFGGEWFMGSNLAAFGGALGQFAKSTGGYLEGRFYATPKLQFNAGFGTDRLFDTSVPPRPLDRNTSVFSNFIYHFTPELATSVEYRWLSTRTTPGETRHNHHLDFVWAYTF